MKTICGWCGRAMAETAEVGSDPEAVTHGICAECAAFFENNRGVGIREFIGQLGAPVLILDKDIRVEAMNLAAGAYVDLRLPEIEGLLVGDVMECAHARLPGGCGNAGVCVMGCALRRIVLETFATGKSAEGVEARQEIMTGQGLREMRFWFSTALADGRVLLRIDRAEVVKGG